MIPAQRAVTGQRLVAPVLATAIVATYWVAFGLDLRHFDVPINNSGDTLWFAVLVKALTQNGWLYDIPQLGAPYSLNAILFPAVSHFDWGVMKLLSLGFSSAGAVLNSFFLVSLAATGVSAFASLRLLKIGHALAAAAAFLYATLPFAFERNVAHICLTYFCVPPICMLCLRLLDRDDREPLRTSALFGVAACVAQGFNYIYFSFFAAILLSFVLTAAILLRLPSIRWKIATLALGALLTATALNLVPSALAWQAEGKPLSIDYKSAAESEIYGLKIRRLLVPHADNVLPGLHYWAQRDASARFPNENENQAARLGLFGTVGFLLALLFGARRLLTSGAGPGGRQDASLVLMVLCLLIGTVGGLGSVFNVLTVADIRGYNRISVFIAFLAFVSLCAWVHARLDTREKARMRRSVVLGVACLFIVSAYDQILEAAPFREARASDVKIATRYGALVGGLENEFGRSGRVYMMPFMSFPTDPGVGRVPPYEHARAYLASDHLSWSWPVLSNRQRVWADRIETTSGDAFVEALIHSGFESVWINRDGYADSAEAVFRRLSAAGATIVETGESDPIRVYDLRQAARDLRAREGAARYALRVAEWQRPVAVAWKSGFYASETGPQGISFRWSQKSSRLEIANGGNAPANVTLRALVQAATNGSLNITVDAEPRTMAISAVPAPLELTIAVPPGGTTAVSFDAIVERVVAPNDARDMYFNLQDVRISDQ